MLAAPPEELGLRVEEVVSLVAASVVVSEGAAVSREAWMVPAGSRVVAGRQGWSEEVAEEAASRVVDRSAAVGSVVVVAVAMPAAVELQVRVVRGAVDLAAVKAATAATMRRARPLAVHTWPGTARQHQPHRTTESIPLDQTHRCSEGTGGSYSLPG